jgi:hypothetical protein
MRVSGQLHAPTALPPGKRPGTHYIEGWVDPRAGLDGCENSRPPPGFDPRTVQCRVKFDSIFSYTRYTVDLNSIRYFTMFVLVFPKPLCF